VSALLTAQADVGAEANHFPAVLTTGVRLAEPDDIALSELD
jgi:hypothetical protein